MAKQGGRKIVDLPGMEGEGVAPVTIPELDKLCGKYVAAKEKRCKETPKEVAAKAELMEGIKSHKDRLPKNSEGETFYRYDDRDYVLEEKLKIKSVETDGD